MSLRVFAAALMTAALGLAALPAWAHSGHDHGDAAPSAPMPKPQPGFGADGTAFQAVLAPQPDGTTLVYLADADTNAPVAGAAIEAEASGWQGAAEPAGSEGVYRLAWTPPAAGADVTLMVMAGGSDDLILVAGVAPEADAVPVTAPPETPWLAWGGMAALGLAASALLLRRRLAAASAAFLLPAGLLLAGGDALAHAGHDHGDTQPATQAVMPGASVTMTKATQFLLGIRTQRVEPREAADTHRVLGRIVPDPSGFAKVQPSQPARVVADPAFPLPVPGQSVRKGEVLVVLEPTLTSVERSDARASLYRVESEIAISERELARQEALAGILPAKTIETTRIRLGQLRREKAQIAGTALGRDLVTAPVDGVVTDVHVVPGEVVGAESVMVEIVDPSRLRVEAVIHDVTAAARVSGAKATTRQLPDDVFPLELLGVSPRIDARDQGIHALFRVDPVQAPRLRLGLPVDVHLATGAMRMANPVPRDAVAEMGGRQVVFVRTAPELFEARPVTVRQVIGPLAEIEGITPGERVVVQGVDQLRAAR